MALNNQLEVLILQHPQEPGHALGSAELAHELLSNSTLKVGLSWRNLTAALGKPGDPSQWAVLYLGSGVKGPVKTQDQVIFLSKKGLPLSEHPNELKGIVVLDGTWSQAKSLWWRNPWLLKLRRAVLAPKTVSAYGNLRKEPRKECLSTIESIALVLENLGESPEISDALRAGFGALLQKHPRSTRDF